MSDDIYGRLLADLMARRKANVAEAVTTNPDQFAAQRRDAREVGVTPDVAAVDPTVARDAAAARVERDLDYAPTLRRFMAERGEVAKLAHDDTGALRKVEESIFERMRRMSKEVQPWERALHDVPIIGTVLRARREQYEAMVEGATRTAQDPGAAVGAAARYTLGAKAGGNTLVGDVAAGFLDLGTGLAGATRAGAEFVGARGFADRADRLATDLSGKADKLSPASDNLFQRGVTSGFRSLGANVPLLPLAFLPGGQPLALGAMGTSAGGRSFQEARTQGVPFGIALPYALAAGSIEAATEAPGVGRLVTDTLLKLPAAAIARRQMLPELVGEQIATAAGDLNDWAVLPSNAGKTLGDYLAERPDAAAETLIASLIGIGGNVAVAKTIQAAAGQLLDQQQAAAAATADAEKLNALLTAATESKLRERDADTFAQLVQAAAEERPGAPTHLYVDAAVLVGEDGQTGGLVSREELAQLVPSITPQQIDEAVATGGALELPLGDVAARIAGTPLAQSLLDHVRTSPDGMSRAEAKEVEAQITDLSKLAQAAVEKASDAMAAENEREAVRQDILAQLTRAGRFTGDVNDVYARITADFFTTMAGRIGLTPQQMYARYPLRIASDAAGGLDQEAPRWYSGSTQRGLTRLAVGEAREGNLYGPGVYAARSREFASTYARAPLNPDGSRGAGGSIYTVAAEPQKPFDTADAKNAKRYKELADTVGKAQANATLAAEGYDAILFKGTRGEELAVFLRDVDVVEDTSTNTAPRAANFDTSGMTLAQSLRKGGNEHQERARELLAASPVPRLSTVKFMRNPVNSPRMRVNADIARYFTLKNAGALGEWGTAAARRKLVAALRHEALYALSQDGSAVGWYDRKVKAAMALVEQIHPELATNDEARFGFTIMLAITSNSTNVNANFDHAEELYSTWKATGQWPTGRVRKAKASKAMRDHMAFVGRLIERDGWVAARDFLTTERPVRDILAHIEDIAPRTKDGKIKGIVSELKDSRVRGALILGSKIGTFYNNLQGNYDSVTMDRWFMRTINRHRGEMLTLPETFTEQLEALRDATDNVEVKDEIEAFLRNPETDIDAVLDALPETLAYTRATYNDYSSGGFEDRSVLNVAAKNVFQSLTLDNQTPKGGADRAELRRVMRDLQTSLAKDGIIIEIADLQAVLWYYEKDLFKLLKREKGTPDAEDYETAARRLLEARGFAPAGAGDGNQHGELFQSLPSGTGLGGPAGRPARRLKGLPSTVKVDGKEVEFGPFQPAHDAAARYMAEAGLDYAPPQVYVKVDAERAKHIAQAFDAMPHAPNDPDVRAAYDAMIRETMAQYRAILATGLKVEFNDGTDPYGNPRNAILDVVQNNHLYVFSTRDGFGSDATFDPSDNPMLAETEFTDANGVPMLANDVFRVVHDYFGHIKDGVGFRADGEENAWRSHAAMYSPLARKAMTTETRGQNSWVNFGPFAEHNRTASGEKTRYADQKVGLLPDWVMEDGRTDPPVRAVLNVGLAVPDTGQFKTRDDVMAALRAAGAKVIGDNQFDSDTEPTVVVELAEPLTPEQAEAVSVATQQQAIAQRLADGSGDLFGPGAESWRPFNPEFFLMPDGTRAAQSALEQRARGTFNPATLQLSLLEDADLTTFLHELGHFALEVLADTAAQPNAPQGVVDDMAAVLRWFGIKGEGDKTALDVWRSMTLDQKRQHHEHFAEAFEQYFFEGKAPSHDLQALFARIRSWMISAYRSIKQFLAGKDKTLTPSVRGVFDRMLASEDAIAETQQINAYAPLFEDAAQAGMSDEEFAKYLALDQQSADNALSALAARSLRDMRWVANARAKALAAEQKRVEGIRKATEEEVRAELEATPVERARAAIRALRREELKTSAAAKQARAAWAARYKQAEAESREAHKGKGTAAEQKLQVQADMLQWELDNPAPQPEIDAGRMQIIAESTGFSSVDEMTKALETAPTIEQELEGLVDRRLLERYGDTTTAAGMARAADAAVHNEARSRFIATGLKVLLDARRGDDGSGKLSVSALLKATKQVAAQVVGGRTIRSLSVQKFKAAEVRAGRAALEAMAKGDAKRAIAETRAQMLNNQLVRTASKAVEEVEKDVEYLRGVAESPTIDPDYRDQIEALLERFDLREVSGPKAEKRKALAAWIEEQRAEGIEPDLPPELVAEAFRKPYRDLTVEEFRGLVAAVRQIEHLGRLKTKLLTAKDEREFKAVREALTGSIVEHAKGRKADTRSPATLRGQAKRFAKSFGAAHLKASTIAHILDGGKDGGLVWEYVIRPANERADWETARVAKATRDLTAILKPWLAAGNPTAETFFPSINRSLTREQVLSIALNTGNDGNLQRLLGGENWTMEQVEPVLRTLTREDWATVQKVWDYLESFRPEVGAKQRRVYGVEPEWVAPTARTHTLADGTTIEVRGGYYPIKYDPLANARASELASAEEAERMLRGAHNTATTRRSFTKPRADEVVGRPLLYALSTLTGGVNDIIHDLAWHEWLIDTNRLLGRRGVGQLIRETYGPEIIEQLDAWRRDIAEGNRGASGAIDAAASLVRQSVSLAGLGYNMMTAATQVLGFANTISRIGVKATASGITQYLANPLRAAREVRDKSSFMAERHTTFNRELNDLKNRVRAASTTLNAVREGAYYMLMKVQSTVDMPTWLGAYEKAILAGNDEARAIALADQMVRSAQGSGAISDLSAIERGSATAKLFTSFYSYFNAVHNLIEAQRRTQGRSNAAWVAHGVMLTVLPAVLMVLMREALTAGGDDDEEKLAQKMIEEGIASLFSTMVGVRELAGAAKMMAGADKQDYQGPAGLRALSVAFRGASAASDGELDAKDLKAVVNMLGLIGLPSAQINRTISGVEALAEGDTENPAALLFGYQEPR